MMVAMGLLKLGTLIRFIPFPVITGFTIGIAVIIFASQIRDLLGLTLPGKEPAAFVPKLQVLAAAISSINLSAIVLAVASIILIVVLKRYRPTWPGLLPPVVISAVAVKLFAIPVETIGSRFGGVPSSLLWPEIPFWSAAKLLSILPDALAIAVFGAITSLLSAVTADSINGRKHYSNTELVAQGIANIGSALFGGICITGAVARTITNVRAGAHGPVSGMMHSLYLLVFHGDAGAVSGDDSVGDTGGHSRSCRLEHGGLAGCHHDAAGPTGGGAGVADHFRVDDLPRPDGRHCCGLCGCSPVPFPAIAPGEMMAKEYDVLVVGGGAAGLASAIGLAQAGLRTSIIGDAGRAAR